MKDGECEQLAQLFSAVGKRGGRQIGARVK